jgi:hypothetical protein
MLIARATKGVDEERTLCCPGCLRIVCAVCCCEQKAQERVAKELEESEAKLEATKAERKQLEEDAFRVTQVTISKRCPVTRHLPVWRTRTVIDLVRCT